VDDVVHQEEVVRTLKRSMETGNLPHLLFYGPPGTGKTSTILAIALQLYGPEEIHNRVLELNASDERGIDVVRNKVKEFSQLAVAKDPSGAYPSPPYKIVILDEADLMTTDAQNALRRTMEHYSRVTRFALICNYVSRIIEPLTSRCAKFRFKPLESGDITERLTLIAEKEGVKVTPEIIATLAQQSGGDLRKAITFLQSAHRLFGDQIDLEAISVIAGVVPDKDVVEIVDSVKSNTFERVSDRVSKLVSDGYSAPQFLEQFHDAIVGDKSVPSLKKAAIVESIALADSRLSDGADELLQLLFVCTQAMKTLGS